MTSKIYDNAAMATTTLKGEGGKKGGGGAGAGEQRRQPGKIVSARSKGFFRATVPLRSSEGTPRRRNISVAISRPRNDRVSTALEPWEIIRDKLFREMPTCVARFIQDCKPRKRYFPVGPRYFDGTIATRNRRLSRINLMTTPGMFSR